MSRKKHFCLDCDRYTSIGNTIWVDAHYSNETKKLAVYKIGSQSEGATFLLVLQHMYSEVPYSETPSLKTKIARTLGVE